MAGTNITVKADGFLKDTRIEGCLCTKCKYNYLRDCNLKTVVIDEKGQCSKYEKI